jgi:uncharacterized protein (TIGR03435 family)
MGIRFFSKTASAALATGLLFAQSFEVAAIHELQPPFQRLKDMRISGSRVTFEGYNVLMLLAEAYDVRNYQLERNSIPGKLTGTYYLIEATALSDLSLSKTQARSMLQNLLADRFHLKIHRETRTMPVDALVVDKSGEKLNPGTGDSDCASLTGPVKPTDRNYRYQFKNCTIEPFVTVLNGTPGADRPVIDKTGLTGRYDISIFATPEFRMQNSVEPGDISIRDSIRQLGLRLNAENDPVEMIVVDHIEAPTPN